MKILIRAVVILLGVIAFLLGKISIQLTKTSDQIATLKPLTHGEWRERLIQLRDSGIEITDEMKYDLLPVVMLEESEVTVNGEVEIHPRFPLDVNITDTLDVNITNDTLEVNIDKVRESIPVHVNR